MKYKIDRFEANYAVVELSDLSTVNVDRRALPRDVREGDVIDVQVDREATEQSRAKTEAMMNRVVRNRQE